ncbi:hypothetical protein [Streptomyces sp. H39-S7]|uniref:hypothetical protein n=1 Tax=Streptomyces sp. H39-S7 TaxID=3004357 RepID=UPI0022AF5715|nr:hypothetical protein [Streptomyces sp. H39-S7]MCZ4121073.1 hypothetical protein [Streptomyces sp. H39-S7]
MWSPPTTTPGLAAALAVANPKNLVPAVGGALSIASSGASTGDRSTKILGDWKAWMAEHNGAIMTVVLAVPGAKYIGDALSALIT